MYSQKRKITFIFEDGYEKKEISRETSFIDGLAMEDVAAVARTFMLMMGFVPEVAESLIFVDKELREELDLEEGSFYGQ